MYAYAAPVSVCNSLLMIPVSVRLPLSPTLASFLPSPPHRYPSLLPLPPPSSPPFPSSQGTRLTLCAGDRAGLLSDVTCTMKRHHLAISAATICTRRGQAVNEFFVVASLTGAAPDSDTLDLLCSEIGPDILTVDFDWEARSHGGHSFGASPSLSPLRGGRGGEGVVVDGGEDVSFSLTGALRSRSERFLTSIGLGWGSSWGSSSGSPCEGGSSLGTSLK